MWMYICINIKTLKYTLCKSQLNFKHFLSSTEVVSPLNYCFGRAALITEAIYAMRGLSSANTKHRNTGHSVVACQNEINCCTASSYSGYSWLHRFYLTQKDRMHAILLSRARVT